MLLYYKGKGSKMGDNLDKKKIRVTFFFWFLTYAMHLKTTRLNSQKLQRAITPTTFHLIG